MHVNSKTGIRHGRGDSGLQDKFSHKSITMHASEQPVVAIEVASSRKIYKFSFVSGFDGDSRTFYEHSFLARNKSLVRKSTVFILLRLWPVLRRPLCAPTRAPMYPHTRIGFPATVVTLPEYQSMHIPSDSNFSFGHT